MTPGGKSQAGDPLLDSLDQLLAVFALQHDDHARNGLAVAQRGAFRRSRADANFRNVAQQNRRAFFRGKTMLPKSPVRDRAPGTQQRVLLGGMLDVASAEIGIVLLHALRDVVKRQAVLLEQRRIDDDLKLLGLAAPRVDLAHAGKRSQLRLDHPLVQILQIHRAHGPGKRVLVELAEGGRGQAQVGCIPRGSEDEICCSRSATSCRAKYIDTESSKTIVTIDSPSFDSDRTSSLFGRPSMARSIG